MRFIIVILIVWAIFAFSLKKRLRDRFSISKALLPLLLTSYLVTFDLGINYLAGAIPKLNDGIGLHSKFAYFIIGEGAWSIELFKRIYDISFFVSIVLTLFYSGALLLKTRRY